MSIASQKQPGKIAKNEKPGSAPMPGKGRVIPLEDYFVHHGGTDKLPNWMFYDVRAELAKMGERYEAEETNQLTPVPRLPAAVGEGVHSGDD